MVMAPFDLRPNVTLRAILAAIVVGTAAYIAGLTTVVSRRIAPNLATMRRSGLQVLELYEEVNSRERALEEMTHQLRSIVEGMRVGPLTGTAREALAAIRPRLDSVAGQPGWIALRDVPSQLQAALVGGADVGSRLGNLLLVSVSAMELGRRATADSVLTEAEGLLQLSNTHRTYTERIALMDMVARERRLIGSSEGALRMVAVWVVLGLALGPLVAWLLYERFFRPLTDLDRAMRRVADGDLGSTAPVRRDDELGRLASHFNEMTHVLQARAEDEQRRAQHLERERIFKYSPDLVATASVNGYFLSVNPAFERALGFTATELTNVPFIELVHPDDRASTREALGQLIGGEGVQAFQNRYRCRDGAYRWLSWDCSPAADGVIYAVARDVTAQREADERQARMALDIERAAREWTLTFDAVDYAIAMLDAGGIIVRVNEAARRLLDRSFDAIIGRTLAELGAGQPWDRAAALSDTVRAGRRGMPSQVTDPSGDRTWTVEAIAVPGGTLARRRVIVVVHEITALVRLERSLRQSETMSAMGTLVAGVAHEVRNPLFSMTATLDAFEARYGGGEQPRHLAVLRTQLTRLTELMQDLLEYGKPAALEMAPGDVGDVVRQAIEACTPEIEDAGVGVQADVSRAVPPVTMDRARMLHVFTNLVLNAVQHSPRGGAVKVDVHLVREDGEGAVECVVSDCGPGFAAEDLPRVLEPFFTRRRGGTGLGLALVQRIVEQHGGEVGVGNGSKGGAIVTVRLPLGPG